MKDNLSPPRADDEPDYLQGRIAFDLANTPGFAETWEPMALALELARARKAKGLSQQAVADAMHIDRARVAELERNPSRVSFGRIVAYAKVLGVRLEPVAVPELGLPAVEGTQKGRPIKTSASKAM